MTADAEDIQEGVGGRRASRHTGVDPRWRKGACKDLSAECQQRFREIHWHDQRYEYASRLVERGVPLAQVRDLLGHASIVTTERYDNQRLEALQAAVERLEGGKTFDPKTDASDKVSRIFQDRTEQRFAVCVFRPMVNAHSGRR
jgi:Phage integrase family